MKYSDYEQNVYRYLRNYNWFKRQIKSIDIELKGLDERIRLLGGLKGVSYDSTAVMGGEKTSTVEQAAIQRDELEQKAAILRENRERISTLIKRIDDALDALDETDREIVRMRYIDGFRWTQIAMKAPYSQRSCITHGQNAVKQIVALIFPVQSREEGRTEFVFACELFQS